MIFNCSDVFFGQNLLHESRGEVGVGAVVKVLRVKKCAAALSSKED